MTGKCALPASTAPPQALMQAAIHASTGPLAASLRLVLGVLLAQKQVWGGRQGRGGGTARQVCACVRWGCGVVG